MENKKIFECNNKSVEKITRQLLRLFFLRNFVSIKKMRSHAGINPIKQTLENIR